MLAALVLAGTAAFSARPATAQEKAVGDRVVPPAIAAVAPMTMEQFLDRLMIAESGGRLLAKNPRSTALGPFQFIESTFLSVARRHFATEIAGLTTIQILALRTEMKFARRAAEVYTRANAALLKSNEVEPTFPHLRLAFLLGPGGAMKVLKAAPDTPLTSLLGPAVLIANPFMVTMTARGLTMRSAREVNQPVTTADGVEVPADAIASAVAARRAVVPGVMVRCNLRLPSCKRWVSLQTAKLRGKKPGKGAVATAVVLKLAASPPSGLGAGKVRRKK